MKNYLATTLTAAALATSLFASSASANTEVPPEVTITICVGVIVQVCVEFPI